MGNVTATWIGTGTNAAFDPVLKKRISWTSGGSATISDELAKQLAVTYGTDFEFTTGVALLTDESVDASTGTAASEEVSGKSWTQAEFVISCTVAGSTGSVVFYVQASDDGTTWVSIPCYDASAGASDMVGSKSLTATDAIKLVVDTWKPYLRLYVDNNRDAAATINATAYLS